MTIKKIVVYCKDQHTCEDCNTNEILLMCNTKTGYTGFRCTELNTGSDYLTYSAVFTGVDYDKSSLLGARWFAENAGLEG